MDKKEKSFKYTGTTKFLVGSFVLLIFFSVAVFAVLGTYMERESEKTIDDLGNMYMSSMGERISKHFETIVNLRLKQAEAVVTVVSTEGKDAGEIYDELQDGSQGFYLPGTVFRIRGTGDIVRRRGGSD